MVSSTAYFSASTPTGTQASSRIPVSWRSGIEIAYFDYCHANDAAHPIYRSGHRRLRERGSKDARGLAEEIVSRTLVGKKEGFATQMFLNAISLCQANRSILLEEGRVKAKKECTKAPVDFTTLQLHSFMYKKNHYVKAIKACRDFKSKCSAIELVSEEEFILYAPQEIKCLTASDDAHRLMNWSISVLTSAYQGIDIELDRKAATPNPCSIHNSNKNPTDESFMGE